MPQQTKPARLALYKHTPFWQIVDRGKTRSTGSTSRVEAEKILADYIQTRDRPRSAADPTEVTVAEVLTIYAEEHAPTAADPARIGYAIEALLPFWSEKKVVDIKGETCRAYTRFRGKADGTMRRELSTMQAAVNYCCREGYLTSAPLVTLPPKPEPKHRWLTRSEAARLLWAAYRGHKASHLARFILIGLYTGTRKDAILRMGFEANTIGGWFDLERGLMYRRGDHERQTNKRRTPAQIPRQLRAHLRRWRNAGATWAVEYQGARVGDIKRAFPKAVETAGLKDVTPHTLKHTAITWTLQGGAKIWDCAGFFSTSEDTIRKVYGHHHPDYQASVLQVIERRK